MGSDMSSLSCGTCCSRDKRFNLRSRQRRSARNIYNGSFYETIAPSTLFPRYRRQQRQDRMRPVSSHSATRSNSEPTSAAGEGESSFNYQRSTAQVQNLPTQSSNENSVPDDEVEVIESLPDIQTNRNSLHAMGLGSSLEILDCPEMSTISLRTVPSRLILDRRLSPGADGDHPAVVVPRMYEERCASTDEQQEETTTATTVMTVPPNSVNSLFISGITPFDSLQDNEIDEASNDSVFECDRHLDVARNYKEIWNWRAHQMNNNSFSQLCVCGEVHSTNVSLLPQNDPSDGPGFDSDFGASAGVEMRIVSSDCSAANNAICRRAAEVAARSRQDDTRLSNRCSRRPSVSITLMKRRRLPVEDEGHLHVVTNELAGRPENLRSFVRPRPATVSGHEVSSSHVTMEWDPYDYDYGATRWMEYFIPGIAYPHQPLLCQEQFWV